MSDTGWLPAEVLCRSDYTYAQEPRLVAVAGGERREVTEVLRRRHLPDGAGFRVVVGGQVYELLYRTAEDRWLARLLA